jgi:dihydrofolate synthase/folylpolyglutamate synthase
VGIALSGYHAALDFLFARTTGASKLGLERTLGVLALLGDPHRAVPAFHIAGTNGKGSVAATLESLLRHRGLRVGKYTSPHLVDFRERILVDGQPIPEEAVVEFIERWTPEIERVGATFFEATTALAFDWFARAGAQVSVIETGLGGRLDATNVIHPLAAGVVSIGIDHTEFLGDTLESIAREKAGIFKPGAAAAIAEADEGIRALLARLARQAGAAPIETVGEDWRVADITLGSDGTIFGVSGPTGLARLRTPLVGLHQARNATLALAMLHAAGDAWQVAPREAQAGLSTVFLPGRFQRRGEFIFDVAHNPSGAQVLAETLAAVAPPAPVVALLTVLRDKDWRGMMAALAPAVGHFVITSAPTAPESRAWRPEEAIAHAAANGWSAELERDFDRAIARARAAGATVVVTGSFHTVGDAMARLRLSPLDG